MKNKKQDPYNVQLADLANELGGNMAVEYYNVSFTLTKEQLQDMKNKGLSGTSSGSSDYSWPFSSMR